MKYIITNGTATYLISIEKNAFSVRLSFVKSELLGILFRVNNGVKILRDIIAQSP